MEAQGNKKPKRAERVRVPGSKASLTGTREACGRATLPPLPKWTPHHSRWGVFYYPPLNPFEIGT
jgi:hypothetical protein